MRQFFRKSEVEVIEIIKRIVNDNSGGIKFTKLLVELAVGMKIDPDVAEQAIRDCPDLDILDYSWDMGEMKRAKMFVYTP